MSIWLSGAPEGCVNFPVLGDSLSLRIDGFAGPSPFRAKGVMETESVGMNAMRYHFPLPL